MPAVKKNFSPTKLCVLAKGKLVDKVRNVLHLSGERPCRKRKIENISADDSDLSNSTISTSENSSYNWLQIRQEPWAEVIEKWKETYELRCSMEYKDIVDFVKKWPILINLKGKDLLSFTNDLFSIIRDILLV